MNKLPDVDHINEVLEYRDGSLFFKFRPERHFKSARSYHMWNSKFSGKRAGRQMVGQSYRQVMIDGVRYLEHRVIAAMHGIPVDKCIDHIDGNGLNNIPSNLRSATQEQNTRNSRGNHDKSERVGVHKKTNGRFVAYIRDGGKHKHLGTFLKIEDAISVRIAAELSIYGEFSYTLSREAA